MTNAQVIPAPTNPLGSIVVLRSESHLSDDDVTLYAVIANYTGDRCDIAPLGGGTCIWLTAAAELRPMDPACFVLEGDVQAHYGDAADDEDARIIPAAGSLTPGAVVTLDGVKKLRIVTSVPTPGGRFISTIRLGGGEPLTTGVPMFPVAVAFVSS